jgi:hypothetical protein
MLLQTAQEGLEELHRSEDGCRLVVAGEAALVDHPQHLGVVAAEDYRAEGLSDLQRVARVVTLGELLRLELCPQESEVEGQGKPAARHFLPRTWACPITAVAAGQDALPVRPVTRPGHPCLAEEGEDQEEETQRSLAAPEEEVVEYQPLTSEEAAPVALPEQMERLLRQERDLV